MYRNSHNEHIVYLQFLQPHQRQRRVQQQQKVAYRLIKHHRRVIKSLTLQHLMLFLECEDIDAMKYPKKIVSVTSTLGTGYEQSSSLVFDTTNKTPLTYPADGNERVTITVDLSGESLERAPIVTKIVLSKTTFETITSVEIKITTVTDEGVEEDTPTTINIDNVEENGDTIDLQNVKASKIEITFINPKDGVTTVSIKAGLHVCKEEQSMLCITSIIMLMIRLYMHIKINALSLYLITPQFISTCKIFFLLQHHLPQLQLQH